MATLPYKPKLYAVPAFDAIQDFIFTFSYLGGSIFKNTIVIKDNSTNIEVFRETIASRQLRHLVPANTLTNGSVYNVTIQVFDEYDNVSLFSDPILAYCFSTPVFSFLNLTQDAIITASYLSVQLSYTQTESEVLNQYNVFLYNANMIEIYTTGALYNVTELSSTISNLINGDFYYMRATGVTLHNMIVDTGYIAFSVKYIKPPVYTLLGLENKPDIGSISISPNLIVITGEANTATPTYLNDTEIDLTQEGSYVNFDEGFSLSNDFTIRMVGRNLSPFTTIMKLDNGEYIVDILFRKGTFDLVAGEKAYFELRAYNPLTHYVQMSNYLDIPLSTDNIYIWIRRIGSVYEIKAEKII